MNKKLKPSKFIYDRIRSLGYVHPEADGYVKSCPSHIKFRHSLYKVVGVLFLMYSAFCIGTSF